MSGNVRQTIWNDLQLSQALRHWDTFGIVPAALIGTSIYQHRRQAGMGSAMSTTSQIGL